MYDELTQVDIDKMNEEIAYRKTVLRPKLIEDVQTARGFGDLSENFEYKCAKRDKNRNDSRIRYLERMVATARKAGIAEETSADEPAARAFIAWVWEMNRAMEIPSCIPEIRAADIPALAAHAAKESNPLYPVPKRMGEREL